MPPMLGGFLHEVEHRIREETTQVVSIKFYASNLELWIYVQRNEFSS